MGWLQWGQIIMAVPFVAGFDVEIESYHGGKAAPHPRTCSACALWFQQPDDKMTPFGYGRCPHLPVGQYLAPEAACRLPGRFMGKP